MKNYKIMLLTLLMLSVNAHSDDSVIKDCASMAESALRTYTTHRDDKAFLAVTYSKHCGVDTSYSSLSSSKKSSFNAAYKRILRLGYGNEGQQSNTQEAYKSFCNKNSSLFKSDQELFNEVSTIRDQALKTVELCIRSRQNRVSASYITPSEPEDLVTVTFQSIGGGSQLLLGVNGRNVECKHGNTVVGPQLNPSIKISSDAVSITCHRRHQPIKIYGLDGSHYPRAQITFYTNYSDTALDIILPEGVTGPLDERLALIEKRLDSDTVKRNTVAAFALPNGCPNGWGAYTKADGRTIIGANSKYILETPGGAETHTLKPPQMPSHNHSTYISNETGRRVEHGQASKGGGMMAADEGQVNRVTGFAGQGKAHNIMQPYVPLYYCMKL